MSANMASSEDDLVERTVVWLRERLPASWQVGRTSRVEVREPSGGHGGAALDLRGPNGVYVTIAVEAKRSFCPRDVDRLQGSLGRVFRTLAGNIPILVVSLWLSQRTQDLLRKEGINYLDLTGNALLRLDNPTVIIETQGASKDPSPAPRSKPRIRGPKAGRLVRMLVDVSPPYGVRDLAEAADLSPGYVSRLLDALDDEALVERNAFGRVDSVDIAGLLRRWGRTTSSSRTEPPAIWCPPVQAQLCRVLRTWQNDSPSLAPLPRFALLPLPDLPCSRPTATTRASSPKLWVYFPPTREPTSFFCNPSTPWCGKEHRRTGVSPTCSIPNGYRLPHWQRSDARRRRGLDPVDDGQHRGLAPTGSLLAPRSGASVTDQSSVQPQDEDPPDLELSRAVASRLDGTSFGSRLPRHCRVIHQRERPGRDLADRVGSRPGRPTGEMASCRCLSVGHRCTP